jgi:hypothetical protein
VHLTATSASWLNQVERFFALITERKIRRGIHRSVVALRADIMSLIEKHNAELVVPQALPLDQVRRRHPRLDRALLRLQSARKRLMLWTSGSGH